MVIEEKNDKEVVKNAKFLIQLLPKFKLIQFGMISIWKLNFYGQLFIKREEKRNGGGGIRTRDLWVGEFK